MISDIWTVMRKEFKEFLFQRGRRAPLLSMAVMIGMFGIFLPMKVGPGWFSHPMAMIYAYIPCITALNIVADAFAGERERRTLETLLASRLPDTAILFGKIATIVGYAWGTSLAAMLAAVLTVDLKFGHAAVAKKSTMMLLGMHTSTLSSMGILAFVGLFVAVLVTSIGILLSIRSSSVKQAQQTMGMIMMGFFLLPTVGLSLVPHKLLAELFHSISAMGMQEFAVLAAWTFITVDAALVALAMARFKRSRLILD